MFVRSQAPHRSSRRAAVIAAAYTALVGLFPSRAPALYASYAASVAALTDRCDARHSSGSKRSCTERIERGLRRFRRREQTFTLTTAGQPSRTYTSIADAHADGNHARVWGAMHYPSTVAVSDAVGEAIATYVNRHAMQRLRER